MADRFISSGHTYLHWQRICLECTYQAGYGSYGIISGTDNMGIFYCHSFPGAVGRVPWWFCGAYGAFPLWSAFGMFLCPGDAGNRLCHIGEEHTSAVSVLRIYRRDWSGNRIYYSGIHSGQVVSKAQRICHWYGHHGIWICRTDCRTGYATSYGSLWTGQ